MRKSSSTNGKALVIVESPAKAKTINKYLGDDFEVQASMGHVRDLPSKGLNVDIENNFEPTYDIMPGKRKVIASLKAAAKKCDKLYLATDLDREGEAIAWHLAEILGFLGRIDADHRLEGPFGTVFGDGAHARAARASENPPRNRTSRAGTAQRSLASARGDDAEHCSAPPRPPPGAQVRPRPDQPGQGEP